MINVIAMFFERHCEITKEQAKIFLNITFLLYKVSVFHPEDTLTATVGHQLVAQVLRPVCPLIWPAAVPGKATPGVPQPQQPDVWAKIEEQG